MRPELELGRSASGTAAPLPSSTMPGRGTLERMPKWLICIPLVCQWLWLALRYRSATLPAAANPAITAGGLVGEGKLEYFRDMGPVARAATARYCALSTHCRSSSAELRQMMADAALHFPVVAKPDLGLCGYGVRRIDDLVVLQAYLAAFPANETVVLQEYLGQEGEAGIFYARDPDAGAGRIIGLALRYFPRVTGDGRRTLAELIVADPRASRLLDSARHSRPTDAERIPAAGEQVRLATIGSTRVGGLYRDGRQWITPALTAAIDAIARDMPQFHFGRFDVRFDELPALADGTGFTIMEINGAGSEAIQAWDPETPLLRGVAMIFAKQRTLFAIGDSMRRRGVKPLGLLALARLNRRQNLLIDRYPPSN
ncbi:MAG: hypothetical protein H7327_09700 [Herminiimonas sp.]|nr:hypothetical protein [Herminiimonas sp.]